MTKARHTGRALVLAALGVAVSACSGQSTIDAGTYTGSTATKTAITVDVGAGVSLDGMPMRQDKDGTFVGVKDRQVRMRCRPASRGAELTCDINRHGQSETDLLMKL